MQNQRNRVIAIFILILINVGCDQTSKQIVRENVNYYDRIELISDYVILTKVENTGAMLSLGADLPEYLRVIFIQYLPLFFLVLSLAYVLFSKKIAQLSLIGFCFIIGGGIGNIIDRLYFGSVTDFLNIGIGNLRTGIFNLADVSIMLGVCIIIYSLLRPNQRKETTANPEL